MISATRILGLAALIPILTALVTDSPILAQTPSPTPRQQEHGKLYNKLGTHRKISEIGATGEITIVRGAETAGGPFGPTHVRPADFLRGIACDSDAVLIGTAVDASSALTEDETFLFTDYVFIVEEVVKNDSPARLAANGQVIITRAGGSLEINGRRIRAEDQNFRPFRIGARYLVYLKHVPTTGSYQAFPDRSFELRNNKFFKLTPRRTWSEKAFRLDDAASFLIEVRASLSGPCNPD